MSHKVCPVCQNTAPCNEIECYHICETCLMNCPYSKYHLPGMSIMRQEELRGAVLKHRKPKVLEDEQFANG